MAAAEHGGGRPPGPDDGDAAATARVASRATSTGSRSVSTTASTLGRPVRRSEWTPTGRGLLPGWIPESVLAVVLGLGTGAAVAYQPVPRLLIVGAAVGLLAALVIFASPVLAAGLLGLSIPEIQDVTGGHFGGLHVAAIT